MTRRLVIEADGGARGNPGPAAYGAVVRDAATGRLLAERAATIGTATNNVAEYRGLIAGLRAARDIDPGAFLDVRLDSKLLVEQMSGRWKLKNPDLRALAIAARDLAPAGRVSYTWIPREKNKAADALVNAALDAAAAGAPFGVTGDDFDGAGSREGVAPEVGRGVEPALGVGQLELGSDELGLVSPIPAIPGWGPDLGPATTLLLVRHGVTDYTARRRFSGSGGADPDLTDLGRQQALAVAEGLRARGGADVIVSSPSRRTLATADAISAELAAPIEVLPDLRECAFGEWDGLSFGEVAAGWPELMRSWLVSADVAPPGGETLRAVAKRVRAALFEVRERHAGARVVVVSHVTPIRVAVGEVVDAPLTAVTRLEVPPTSVTTIAWWHDGNCALRGFADVSHWPDLARSGH